MGVLLENPIQIGQISFSTIPFVSANLYLYGATSLIFASVIPNSSSNLRDAASSAVSFKRGCPQTVFVHTLGNAFFVEERFVMSSSLVSLNKKSEKAL